MKTKDVITTRIIAETDNLAEWIRDYCITGQAPNVDKIALREGLQELAIRVMKTRQIR